MKISHAIGFITSGLFLIATSHGLQQDARIERANELGVSPDLVRRFDEADKNHDGKISGEDQIAKAEQSGDGFISTLERLNLLKR